MGEPNSKLSFETSRRLSRQAHDLIPGGAHTYAKGDDQYPELAPGFIARGEGCHVWDVDGNEYIEYGMGLRAVTLGHAYGPVVEAASEQMRRGANYTRPAPIEVECAEAVLSVLPQAEQVKFAKDGSTVITAAVRLARAHTRRELVAFCSDHPFFSYNDWFIGHSPMSAGIPGAEIELTRTFRYNDLESLKTLFAQEPGRIACVVMEAEREEPPQEGYLQAVQQLCREQGALFVLDEMITGFRWHLGGAQAVYDLDPDLSGFGKALANGFSVSALVGKKEVMQLGGWGHDHDRVFLLSTTHGAENHGLAAAVATIDVYKKEDVIGVLHRQGERLKKGVDQVVAAAGLEDYIQVAGRPCNLVYATRDQNRERSQPFRTLFMQEIIRRGVLGPSFVVSYSHSNADIDRTVEAVEGALDVYGRALQDGVEKYLVGRSVQPAVRKRG
jgi:glutamate-1-semialdehyde 2,1-aminomutase